jgi:hypothetical protein
MATKKAAVKSATNTAQKNTPKKTVLVKKVETISPKKEIVNPNIYPIGKQQMPSEFNDETIAKLIDDIKKLPKLLKTVSKKIDSKKKLQYSYREGGWSIEQIIHHTADSHLNAFLRFKLALTENNPTIKPYDENLWSETADIQLPVKVSINLLKSLHKKWVMLLKNMDKNDFNRTYHHPVYKTTPKLKEVLAIYAWHGKHHVAQIEVALKLNEVKK